MTNTGKYSAATFSKFRSGLHNQYYQHTTPYFDIIKALLVLKYGEIVLNPSSIMYLVCIHQNVMSYSCKCVFTSINAIEILLIVRIFLC